MNARESKNDASLMPFAPKVGTNAGNNAAAGQALSQVDYGAGIVFADDASDAAEYLETIRRKVALEPERHLMLAVLEDAVTCFQKNLHARSAKKRLQFEEAEAWILDENDRALFSFESICNILGIEPSYLRRGLKTWKRERIKERISLPAKAA